MKDHTCGQPGHDRSCLCDVRISIPVEVNAQLLMGSAYADYWSRANGEPLNLLDFLESLAQARDEVVEEMAKPTAPLAVTREAVLDYLQQGGSMADVDLELGLTIEDAVAALTNGRPSILREFKHEEEWSYLESHVRGYLNGDDKRTQKEIAAWLAMSVKQFRTLLRYYGGEE